MIAGIVIFSIIALAIVIGVSWYWGYSIGQRDAYMDYFQKKEYYEWIMEVKRKQNWE